MMRRTLAILCLPFLAVACTKNPLGPGLSSAAQTSSSLCPDRYNFQSPSSVSAWTAPVGWTPPVSDTNLVWDPTHSFCGYGAMRGSLDIWEGATNPTDPADGGASAQGILYTLFSQTPGMASMQNASNAHVVMDIYFDQPPPVELGLKFVFLDRYDNYVEPVDAAHYGGLTQGWNVLTEDFYLNSAPQLGDITHVVGFLIQINNNNLDLSNGPPYITNFWIGGINW
jgi:hypothetical protein